MSSLLRFATIQIRQDTAGDWTSENPTPYQGEWCLETNTGYTKLGDGSTAWNDLPYNGDFPYGETYGDEIDWTQESAVQDQWYPVSDSDMTVDEIYLMTSDGSGQLTATIAGVYLITYNVVFTSDQANEHIHTGIEIDNSGTPHLSSQDHTEIKFANTETSIAHTALLTMTAGQTLNFMIQTADAGSPDITVEDLHITCHMIGRP